MNKTQAVKKADALFSKEVRSVGYCEAQIYPPVKCNGNLQCCHIRSRRYRAVRWLRENAVCMCAAHHLYFTHHPLEWEEFAQALRGPMRFDRLREMALNNPPMDPFDVIERLSGSATERR